MKFICSKTTMCEAISNVSKAVSPKSTIQALEGMKLKLSYNILELTGYDLEIGIRTEIQVKSDDTGEFIINPRLFSDIVKRMPADDIFFEIGDNYDMTISGGPTKYNIAVMASDEYPDLPSLQNNNCITLRQSVLKSMISQSIYAVSLSDNKPVLTGELFDINGNNFNLVAIDGYRLAIRNETISNEEDYKFVVPSKALNEAARLLKDEDELIVSIFTDNKHIMFDINGYKFFARLLEGDFHNYKASIFTDFKSEIIVNTKELIDCLERCSLLISEKHKSPVKCIFGSDGMLTLSCSTAVGKINDEIPVNVKGDSVTIGFNNKYLLDALKASECDKVRFLMNGGTKPVKILPPEGESFTYLVMPVVLK